MKQHKWAKEIKAWADGAEIEQADIRENANPYWYECDNPPKWDTTFYQYRIKPQPKEPQYLYAWLNKDDDTVALEAFHPNGILEDKLFKYIGKIKLEAEE